MSLLQETWLKGTPVSDGIAVGELFLLPQDSEEVILEVCIEQEYIELEIAKYRMALEHSREDLLFLRFSLEKEGAKEALEIIAAHVQMLDDPLFTCHVEENIRQLQKNAESVFSQAIREYEKKFSRIKDPFFQQRIVDVLDVSKRILGHLTQTGKVHIPEIPPGAIIFARELAPSHTAAIQASRIGAFITLHGGGSSHSALIARAKGIPYVSHIDLGGIESTGAISVVVDGKTGEVILQPSLETLEKYQEMKRRLRTTYRLLRQDVHPITETVDGYPVHIYANVGSLADLQEIHVYKPEGIGLLRSEYLFLDRNTVFLSEEEQVGVYTEVAAGVKDLSLVMRVFDIGWDKNPDVFLEHQKEDNPVLGCRGIRFLLRHPAVFRTQLRAILRACKDIPVKLLLPLISDIREVIEAKVCIEQVRQELYAQGLISDRPILVGCMIEVPSAVLLCDAIVKEVDFVSIGTNDLVQYTLGMDRSNPAMSDFFYPAHPSILRMIKMVVMEAKRQGKPVTICGEIASSPLFVPLLLGLGVSELSCSPRHIPLVKRAVRKCVLLETFKLARKILQMSSSEEIDRALAGLCMEKELEG